LARAAAAARAAVAVGLGSFDELVVENHHFEWVNQL